MGATKSERSALERAIVFGSPKLVSITEQVAQKVKKFIAKEGKTNGALRLYVTGGGCSGLTYGLALEENASEDDHVLEEHGLRVLVDPFSAKYVKGSVIDYVESLQGAGFKIDNPNVVSTCACGHSFHAGQ